MLYHKIAKRLLLAIGAVMLISQAYADTLVKPSNRHIRYTGRINFSNPESPLFVFPGTQIAVNISGTGLSMKAKPGSGQFMVTIDDGEEFKINFTDTDSTIVLASGLEPGKHTVKVMLAIEGYEKRPEFRGFVLDGSTKLLSAPQRQKHRLEFIGNSITCGYGSEAKNQWVHYSYDNSNHYYTYAAILGRELDAQEVCVARSGIGVYRNYGGKQVGQTMTRWYDYTCIYDSTQLWDFSKYRPDVICVNLGTNDLSTKGYDINTYRLAYKQFIEHLAQVQPKAKIVILSSQMLTRSTRALQIKTLKGVYEELKANGLNVYFVELQEQDPALGYGADWHPSKRQHRQTADQLKPILKKLLDGK